MGAVPALAEEATVVEIPEANVQVTTYEVCCLPPGWKARRHFLLTVEYRGGDRWVVMADSFCLDADGKRGWERMSSNREDFRARFYLTLDDALALAKRAAPTLTVGQHTVADALEYGPGWS